MDERYCSSCGGLLKITVRRRYSLLDIFGVLIVGSIVFGILGIIIFSSEFSKGIFSILWVAGLVAFGLYHMVGFKSTKSWVCSQCGKSGIEK